MNRCILRSIALSLLFACASEGAEVKTVSASAEEWTLPRTDAPLGSPHARQTVTSKEVTRGVTYYQIRRGEIDRSAFWTVNLGFFSSCAAAQRASQSLRDIGVATRIDPSAGRNVDGSTYGYWLSSGRYPSQAAAITAAGRIAKNSGGKYKPGARNTTLAGFPTVGPWIIHILAIRPAETTAALAVIPAGDNNLGAGGETVSAAAARWGALAGTNGSFFSNINPFHEAAPERSPLGATVIRGNLIATAAGGRPGVMFEREASRHPKVRILRDLTTRVTVSDGQGESAEVRAIDRPILGTVVNCGAPGESPARKPAHDSVCTNYDDLVMYDGLYLRGKASNIRVDRQYKGPVYELVLDARGSVVRGDASLGAAPPAGGRVLQGLGSSAVWLRGHSTSGTELRLEERVFSEGVEIPLTSGISILEGGPMLSDAALDASAARDGFGPSVKGLDAGDAGGGVHDDWYNGWYVSRNGRTALGITEDGTVLIVEIDGRQPTLSLGASIPEMAATMKWLGATSAINLDGGGSSDIVVEGVRVGHPSDPGGERGVGDSLLLLPQ